MKNIFKNSKYLIAFLFGSLLISCGDDGDDISPIEKPIAGFAIEKNEENNLIVTFTNSSIGGASFVWDFGDGSDGATESTTTHTYTASGTYTVTLTVTNESGSDESTQDITVSGFGSNLVTDGDMSNPSAWTLAALWGADDNVMNHAFNDTSMVFLSGADPVTGDPYQYSNYMLYQEVALEGGKTYKFSADVSSTTGANATWFEVYMLKAKPEAEADIEYMQVGLKGYGDGENCIASAFSGDIIDVSKGCTATNAYDQMLDATGMFTPPTDSLSANSSIFLVFKVGSGWAAEGEIAGFGDGLFLDNVVIKEAL